MTTKSRATTTIAISQKCRIELERRKNAYKARTGKTNTSVGDIVYALLFPRG